MTPAKLQIDCQNVLFYVKNKIEKSFHLACIQQKNQNAVAYGFRDVAIIL